MFHAGSDINVASGDKTIVAFTSGLYRGGRRNNQRHRGSAITNYFPFKFDKQVVRVRTSFTALISDPRKKLGYSFAGN